MLVRRLLPPMASGASTILLAERPLPPFGVDAFRCSAIQATTRQYVAPGHRLLVLVLIPSDHSCAQSRAAAEPRIYRSAAYLEHVCAALPNHRRTARLIPQVCRPPSAAPPHV